MLKAQAGAQCGHCKHREVCKYKDDYEDALHFLRVAITKRNVFAREQMDNFMVRHCL